MTLQPLSSSLPAAPQRRLDVTVSDGGVERSTRSVEAPAPAAPAPVRPATVAAAPTSTPAVAATQSADEQQALGERFADLPRSGVTGTYNPQGRAVSPSHGLLPGSLLDITG